MAINFKYAITEIPPKEGLIKVDTYRLQTGVALPFNVYVSESGVIKKIFNKGNILNKLFIDVLKEKGYDQVYIDRREIKSLELYLSKKELKPKKKDIQIAFNDYSFFKEKHFQIDKKLIIPGVEINFTIYGLQGLDLKKLVVASADKPVKVDENMLLFEGDFLIEDKDIPLYEEYVKSIQDYLKDFNLSKDDAKELSNLIFKENSRVLMKELLKDPRSGEKIKQVSNVVDDIINRVIEEPDSVYSLLTIKGYDYYTYTHSINVGVLAIGLGIQLKMEKERLNKLGIGAMLHDLGKVRIPHEILNKQGKLTDTEYRIIQQHVNFGYEFLKDNKDFPKESMPAVLQHHEKISGRGYPYRLKENEIELFGRITAIADCYDALTTRRPYKAPLTPFFALSIIAKDKNDYDRNILVEFIKMLGKIR